MPCHTTDFPRVKESFVVHVVLTRIHTLPWQDLSLSHEHTTEQLMECIRPDVEYRLALFKYYHGNNPSCGAPLGSHKLFKYRHSDTPFISTRVMSWEHYLPLLCSSVLCCCLLFLSIWLMPFVAKDTWKFWYSDWSQLIFALDLWVKQWGWEEYNPIQL